MSQLDFAIFDEHGVDPLKDVFFENMDNIGYIAEHLVTQNDVGNADLLSLDYYETQKYGFAILRYNGVLHENDLEVGSTIRIPDLKAVRNHARNVRLKGQAVEVTI